MMPLNQYRQKILRLHTVHRLLLMGMKTDKTEKEAKTWYKQYFYDWVRVLSAFCPGHFVCVDWSPTLKTTAEQMAEKRGSKFLPKSVGLFITTAVNSHTITISEDCLTNILSVYRATSALGPNNTPTVKQLIRNVESHNTPPDYTPEALGHKMHIAT